MTAWPEVRIDATAAPSSRHTLAELLPQDCHASATLDEISRTYPVRALRRSAGDKFSTTGKSLLIVRNRVKPRNQKYSLSTSGKSMALASPIPAHPRGVSRSSRCVGSGMRWTLWRQACFSRQTKTPRRTAKSCGPGAAMLALSLVGSFFAR